MEHRLQARLGYDLKQGKLFWQTSRRIYRGDKYSMFMLDLLSGRYSFFGPSSKLP